MIICRIYMFYIIFYPMEQKGMTFDPNFYAIVGKQCRTENAYAGH